MLIKPGHIDGPHYRNVALGILFVHYALNYVDRQLIGILAIPIKQELHLSDTQLGLLGGFAFAIFYSTLAIPIALLADRVNRTAVISIALGLWSGFTALCGVAGSFGQLFLFRLFVGIGEAGGTAPAYSLIADFFPPEKRARALSILMLGLPVGSALGLFLGGIIATRFGWRVAFQIIGAIGVLVAPIVWFAVREPIRGRYDGINGRADQAFTPRPSHYLRVYAKPAFWLLSLGMAGDATLLYGFGFWMPAFLQRSHALGLQDTSITLGGLVLVGGISGNLLGGWLGDRLGSARIGFYAYVPSVAFLVTLPVLIVALWVKNTAIAIAILVIPQACGIIASSPIGAAIQLLGPASMRTTVVASYLLVCNLIGLGFGALAMGSISDHFTKIYGQDGLRYAMMLCALVLYPLTSALFFLAGRRLDRDRHHSHKSFEPKLTNLDLGA